MFSVQVVLHFLAVVIVYFSVSLPGVCVRARVRVRVRVCVC